MEMDLQQNRYLDFAALRRYAHLVAGVVGEMSASIFGYRQAATLEYAGRLGLALQLINIIRDVGDDARRGRIYLPLDEMQRFGVKVADVLQGRYRRWLRADDAVPGRASAYGLSRGHGAASGGRPQGAAHWIDHGRRFTQLCSMRSNATASAC